MPHGILGLLMGAVFAAVRLAATQLADEETDRHGWLDATGERRWLTTMVGRSQPLERVLDLPEARPAGARSAA